MSAKAKKRRRVSREGRTGAALLVRNDCIKMKLSSPSYNFYTCQHDQPLSFKYVLANKTDHWYS